MSKTRQADSKIHEDQFNRLENLLETHPDKAEIHSELACLLKNTGEYPLRTGQLTLLKQLLTALRTNLSETRVDSVYTDLVMTADELFREDEIDIDTYTRMATLCQD
ncbi:hypothetical protein PM030_14955 [Halorubrum ezzemoulense]|uniref:hypothetical protein n=1 Tax=Halorubrum ezzemoulense TaxID=337243 RepID=UPI00232BB04F|nr:hypothetical protein [Halorubrum ezzemoulense]MDB2283169.1 hypothetical protein [Halorubrum ezzemoulense]